MDLQDLATFEAVARSGSITRAAERLATVQSNVTTRIQLLEQELGVPLFYRHSRGVTLTSAGQQLVPYAERIRQLAEEARRALQDAAHPSGPLRVGSLETTASRRLPSILTAYAAAYPQVDIVLQTGTTAELVQAVLERQLEAALVAGPVAHPEVVGVPIVCEELVVVTAPSVPDLDAALAEAREVKVVVLRRGCSYRERLEHLLAMRGRLVARVLELGTLDAIVGCVSANLGLTLLPRSVMEPYADRGLVRLHALPPGDGQVETVLIRRRDAFVSSALERFIAACQQAAPSPVLPSQRGLAGGKRSA
jgi:LysR family transcriptional regulator, cell division regulator